MRASTEPVVADMEFDRVESERKPIMDKYQQHTNFHLANMWLKVTYHETIY